MREGFTVQFDRRRGFVIDNEPPSGPDEFFATKNSPVMARRLVHCKVIAAAVRELGTEKFSCVLGFIYAAPLPLQSSLITWTAVPRQMLI